MWVRARGFHKDLTCRHVGYSRTAASTRNRRRLTAHIHACHLRRAAPLRDNEPPYVIESLLHHVGGQAGSSPLSLRIHYWDGGSSSPFPPTQVPFTWWASSACPR